MLANVAILAGGMGTRLSSRANGLPKPMVKVLGIPILEHQIKACAKYGHTSIVLLVHHHYEVIQHYFGNGEKFGVDIYYSIESEARGTAGALKDASNFLAEDFLVLYADTYFDVDLNMFLSESINSGASGTLFLHPNDHPYDSDIVEINSSDRIIAIHQCPHRDDIKHRNLVNAALYWFKKFPLLKFIPEKGKFDLMKDILPLILKQDIVINGYISAEYIKDMGTPSRLDRVEHDILSGAVERLSIRGMRAAIFIDRDGTINEEINHLKLVSQMRLIEGSAEAIHQINKAGTLAICITNQPVIARGEINEEDLKKIHYDLEYKLSEHNAYLNAIYYCPHHPDKGFPGELVEYKKKCTCRKPGTALIENSIRDFNINIESSWMIGDSTTDILAGKNIGLNTILVRTGHGGKDEKCHAAPDYVFNNLLDAVNWIFNGHNKLVQKITPIINEILNERVVLVSGLSKSGKSTFSKVLQGEIQKKGVKCHIIPLDSWLKPKANRHEGWGVCSRYDLSNLIIQLDELIKADKQYDLTMPTLNHLNSEIIGNSVLSVLPNEMIIIEGVTALNDINIRRYSKSVFFMKTSENLRLKRMRTEYAGRGYSPDEIINLIKLREVDEVTPINLASSDARFTITLEEGDDS